MKQEERLLRSHEMTSKKAPVARKTTRKKKANPEVGQPVKNGEALPVMPLVIQEPVVIQEITPAPDSRIYKHPAQLLILALILGWAIDFLFWKHTAGINFAIFMLLCLLGGLYWLFSNGLKPDRKSLWLLIPFLFFAVVTFLRQEPLTIFLAFTFTLLSVGLFGSSYIGGRWYQYGLLHYLYKFFLLISDMFAALASYIPKVQRIEANPQSGKSEFPVWGLLRGLLFAFPIVICFGSLLAAGDLVFKEKLNDFLNLGDLSENIFRGILILFYAYILAGMLIHAALKSKDESLVGEDKPVLRSFLGFAESTVILGSVSVLFLAFVVVQFQYFFGGETNIGVEGYTYSQYARRGFNELVTVAFFSLVLILGLSSISRRDSESQKRIYSSLSVALAVLVVVILVSAYQRISLGIDWHGFSRLRLYPRVFLVWLGFLFVTVVVLEIVREERYFAFAAILASVGFAASLTWVNVDAATVRHNVPRTLHGKNLNVAHLASLSSDAVPALAHEFYSESYPQNVHEGIGAALTCYLDNDSNYEKTMSDWRSFNLSRWRAHNALQNAEKYLQHYGINDARSWDVKVRTPSNVWYECDYYSGSEEE